MIKIVTSMNAIDAKRINGLIHPLMDVNHKVIKEMLTYATDFELRLEDNDYRIHYGKNYSLHIEFDWHNLCIRVLECEGNERNTHYFKNVDELQFFYKQNALKAKEAANMLSDFKPLTEYFPFDELIKISRWYNVMCNCINKDGKVIYEYWFDDNLDEDITMVCATKLPNDELYYVHTFQYEEDSEEAKLTHEHMQLRDDVYYSLATKINEEELVSFVKSNL